MSSLGSPSPPGSPSFRGRRRPWARKCERYCCSVLSCFPLVFVYGLTSWAVWVEAGIGLLPIKAWTGYTTSILGVILYVLLNWSYSVAVFTDAGSPMNTQDGYSHLPTDDEQAYTSFTVKSTGDIRFCKKCQVKKPDRAHHCSTCRRCVLKMDHHCPWLATCVGLRNYKPFLLFLIYTCLFCWLCFAVAITWVWSEILSENQFAQMLMPVNYVMLTVLAGIIGLVLSGFTFWHIYLAYTGQTTIESLEKTRYLSPIRKGLQNHINGPRNYVNGVPTPSYGQQLAEIHANALPGITRPEEGDASSPATASLRSNYRDLELARERDRYQEYLDERDSEKLPNAFDLGWRRNLTHVFGERPLLWFLPVCNTTGDGWRWEASKKWLVARDDISRERARLRGAEPQQEHAAEDRARLLSGSPRGRVQRGANASPRGARRIDEDYAYPSGSLNEASNWNDVPDDMLSSRRAR
ncbi:zf-DHHC-domain-containing protein [Viridothelium virens]|uniref:Palmitoyltransferase n=1 Tax=Viridothelium virens TaxID=1048519 RepID=A0A6A6HNK2_VIRVR|nr:zf-DHHC-domain-containing protein [Viridothelium virens]